MSDAISGTGRFGILMFMIGSISVLSSSALTTLALLYEHGNPDPVIADALAAMLILTTAGAWLFAASFVNWTAIWSKTREVFGQ